MKTYKAYVNKEAYRESVKAFPDDCAESSDIVHALRMGYQVCYDKHKPINEQKQTESTCKWHTMDEEPLETGVILYSDRANRIYDGSYIGGGRFDVDRLSVPAGNFTLWCQRSEFFKECKLRESLDKLEE